jgi:hypothetical protein
MIFEFFTNAAKVIGAGLSTFGLAGAGAGIGIVFGSFLSLSLISISFKIFKSCKLMYLNNGFYETLNYIKENSRNVAVLYFILISNFFFLIDQKNLFLLNLILIYFIVLELGMFYHISDKSKTLISLIAVIMCCSLRVLLFLSPVPKLPFIIWMLESWTNFALAFKDGLNSLNNFIEKNPKGTRGLLYFGLAVGTVHGVAAGIDIVTTISISDAIISHDVLSSKIQLNAEYNMQTYALKQERLIAYENILRLNNQLIVPRLGIFKSTLYSEIQSLRNFHSSETIEEASKFAEATSTNSFALIKVDTNFDV